MTRKRPKTEDANPPEYIFRYPAGAPAKRQIIYSTSDPGVFILQDVEPDTVTQHHPDTMTQHHPDTMTQHHPELTKEPHQ